MMEVEEKCYAGPFEEIPYENLSSPRLVWFPRLVIKRDRYFTYLIILLTEINP